MQIRNIKTKDNGQNGLKVEHVQVIEKGGDPYDIFCSDAYTHPISINLETELKKLRIHLLKLCRAWHDSWDKFIDLKTWNLKETDDKVSDDYAQARSAINDVTVTGITSNCEHFVIIGKTKSYDNANINYVTGCVHPSTEYNYYDEAIDIITDAYKSVEEYINGEPESLIQKEQEADSKEGTPEEVPGPFSAKKDVSEDIADRVKEPVGEMVISEDPKENNFDKVVGSKVEGPFSDL